MTVSGPDTGSPCEFPFTFNGVTYVSCAEWVYGGINQGKKWCSTKVDSTGVHVNGEGNFGFCSSECTPNVSLAEILAGLGITANSEDLGGRMQSKDREEIEDTGRRTVEFRGAIEDNPK